MSIKEILQDLYIDNEESAIIYISVVKMKDTLKNLIMKEYNIDAKSIQQLEKKV